MNTKTANLKKLVAIATNEQLRNAAKYATRKLAAMRDPVPWAREILIARSLRRAIAINHLLSTK